MNRSRLLAVLAALAWIPGLSACDLAADPSVQIRAVSHTPAYEDCRNGLSYFVVPEGETIEWEAIAVNASGSSPGGTCEEQEWGEVVAGMNRASRDSFSMHEVFFRGNPQDSVTVMKEFFHGPGTIREPPHSTFEFNLTVQGDLPSLDGLSAGGNSIAAFDAALTQIEEAFIDAENLEPGSGSPSISGRLKPDIDNTVIFWVPSPTSAYTPAQQDALFGGRVNANQNVGYNEDFAPTSVEPGPVHHDNTFTMTFDTPTVPHGTTTIPGSPPPANPPTGEKFYHLYAEAGLPWEIIPEGGNPWAVLSSPACEDNPATTAPPCSDHQGTVVLEMRGKILKRSIPSNIRTHGPDGHPSLAMVMVTDETPPLGAQVVNAGGVGPPFELGEDTEVGDTLTGVDLDIEVYDNNPYADPRQYTVSAWALVERSVYESGFENPLFIGNKQDATLRPLYGDDTFVGAPRHEFRWVPMNPPSAQGLVVTPPDTNFIMRGGQPTGARIQFDTTFAMPEPMGTHWAIGANGGPDHADYVYGGGEGLKIAYQISGPELGGTDRPAAPPPEDTTLAFDDVLGSFGEFQREGATATGALPAAPAGVRAGVDDETMNIACPSCNGYNLYGVPTYGVTDRLDPSAVIVAHDLKYDTWYYFGENFAGDAHGNDNYLVAYELGTVNDPNLANFPVTNWVPPTDVWDNQVDMATQLTPNSFFPSNANVAPNVGDYAGFWIDEDTEVEFFVTAWDNVNNWEVSGVGNGVRDCTFELTDEPTYGAGVHISQTLSFKGESVRHLFRNPNRGGTVAGDPRASVRIDCSDDFGNNRLVDLRIFIADQSLRIFQIEESRRRIAND